MTPLIIALIGFLLFIVVLFIITRFARLLLVVGLILAAIILIFLFGSIIGI